ncbi:hypothetical protein DI09_102p50 [Mitosporidium daphniae]|uniref:Serine aminopeptidase S33 domain-containing protein n=1 Tax=Mitosporidium daphniae TaxID=1485682 RepID=A0A098VZN6_9MICR|nr:uncharacterized protein DI09_102p50 [Mitosporidium daphniae]KGG53221.1 hypothetical protein DI09_102p50 [Mitosporidium daphniae]|eukprot:XP_013239657.1 uncharacterized protein DI09_102p50 [Mitosporidium daphniae]
MKIPFIVLVVTIIYSCSVYGRTSFDTRGDEVVIRQIDNKSKSSELDQQTKDDYNNFEDMVKNTATMVGETQAAIEDTKKGIEDTNGAIAVLKREIYEAEQKSKALREDMNKNNANSAVLQKKMDNAAKEVKDLEDRLNKLNSDIDTAEKMQEDTGKKTIDDENGIKDNNDMIKKNKNKIKKFQERLNTLKGVLQKHLDDLQKGKDGLELLERSVRKTAQEAFTTIADKTTEEASKKKYTPPEENTKKVVVLNMDVEDIKAVVLVVHGLGEHFGRYANFFGHELIKSRIGIAGFDLPGHGANAKNVGYVGKSGFKGLFGAINNAIFALKEHLPAIPIILVTFWLSNR